MANNIEKSVCITPPTNCGDMTNKDNKVMTKVLKTRRNKFNAVSTKEGKVPKQNRLHIYSNISRLYGGTNNHTRVTSITEIVGPNAYKPVFWPAGLAGLAGLLANSTLDRQRRTGCCLAG